MKIVVGSKNKTKIDAVKEAFEEVFTDQKIEVIGVDVESGVSEQPMMEAETIKGATNRAKAAMKAIDADYAVGIEGGITYIAHDHNFKETYKDVDLDEAMAMPIPPFAWYLSDWIAVQSKKGDVGLGGAPRYPIPREIMQHVDESNDLSQSLKKYGHVDIGQKNGYAGLVTNDYFTRKDHNKLGCIIALRSILD